MTPSLRQDFEAYLAMVYPELPAEGSDQLNQLRDAFFAGASVPFRHPWHLPALAEEVKAFWAAKLDPPGDNV